MTRMMFVALLSGCLPLATATLADEPPGDVAKGAALVKDNCAGCHAIAATGSSPLAEAPPLRTLKARYPLDQLYEAFAEGITTGHPDMPEFIFNPQQIGDMLTYIESLDR